MSQHCFLTKDAKSYPAWKLAFPDLILQTEVETISNMAPGVYWILTNLANWEAIVTKALQHDKRVLVLSMSPNIEEAFKAFSAGARGYGHAWSSPFVLKQMDAATEQNGLWVGENLFTELMQLSQRPQSRSKESVLQEESGLSARELEVAKLVAEGKSNKEAARALNITERTVKAHLGAIFRKLNIRDRIQLVLHFKTTKPE